MCYIEVRRKRITVFLRPFFSLYNFIPGDQERRPTMKKLLALILALVMALMCTAAFAEDVGEPFENEVFFTMLNSKPEITKALQAAADQFGAAYKVKIEVVETSNPGDEISKRYNGGEAPTISVVDIAQVKHLAREGKIEPGCEIVVPTKAPRDNSKMTQWLGIGTSFASLGTMIASIAHLVK